MKIIKENAFYEQNINKSRFLGFSFIVNTEDEVEKILKDMQNKYCDCRHIVYAYKIYPNIEKKGNSSEPAGTAGAPILSAIEKNDLTNVLIVVVRYFGGILLGAKNLYRAYSSTALEVILLSGTKEMRKYYCYKLNLSYSEYNNIKLLSEKNDNIKILNTTFSSGICSKIAISEFLDNPLINKLILEQQVTAEEIWL